MSVFRPKIWSALLLAGGLAGCGPTGPQQELGVQGRPIFYGAPDTDPAHAAVVALTQGPGFDYFCSGTLIAPDAVLTAAHCLDQVPIAATQVFFGDDVTSGVGTYLQVASGAAHPDYLPGGEAADIAVLRLTEPAPAGVTPIPALPLALGLTRSDVGAQLQFSGFGLTENGDDGSKLFVEQALEAICGGPDDCGRTVARAFSYSQAGGGPCSGDSGGPAFIERNGQEYVAGVTSYGDEACVDYGVSTSVHAYADFIASQVGAVTELCDNRVDDDGDGLADCADPDCAGQPGCGPATEQCTNWRDDDSDGLVDCADPDCYQHVGCSVADVEICANGMDDDGDMLLDCDDPDCAAFAICEPKEIVLHGGCATAPNAGRSSAGWALVLFLAAWLLRRGQKSGI